MAAITVSDIMNANQLWAASATSWADFLLGIQDNASYLDTNVSHPLSAAWKGTAAELATGQFNTAKGGLIKTAGQLSTIQGLIEDFNKQLSGWQQQLMPLINSARSQGFGVGEDGTVTIPPLSGGAEIIAHHDPSSAGTTATQQAAATKLQDEIQAILRTAGRYDDDTAAVLRNQMPSQGVALQNPTQWDSKYSSLSQIALAYYGNANMWPVIWEANRNTIKDPNIITTGMKVVIPAVSGRPATTASLTPAEASLLAQASGSGSPGASGTPALHLTPEDEREFAIANGVSPTQVGGMTGTHSTGTDSTGTDPISPNSQGLYLPPNATQAESNAS